MFVRPAWKPHSEADVLRFIMEHPWALLVNNGPAGPYATNLPMLLDDSREPKILVGHIARANEHAKALIENTSTALAVFQGPHSYVTSSWYPNRDMPPTFYYTAVHCYGTVMVQNEATLRMWIERLTERYEGRFVNGWKTSEIEESAITRRLKAIVGFELRIDRIEAKFKLGQDEPKRDALAVADALGEAGDQSLAQLVRCYNDDRNEVSV